MEMNWTNQFQQKLLQWYESQQRILPWRGYDDPYGIWVSEIMLQQTRVEAVLPYFERFMAAFPTVEVLAQAEQEEVLKMWEGLGYYSRARNLHQAAQMVVSEYGGHLPSTYDEVRSLPGVGPYTAGAIMSIAFNQPYPAVDGNVKRVFSRLLAIPEDVKQTSVKKRIEEMAEKQIPEGRASDFNQALMELGALICIPKSPRCKVCPVQELCAGFASGEPEAYPVKSAKRQPKPMVRLVALVRRNDQATLLVRNPGEGMLAGLWAFPGIDLTHEEWKSTGEGERFRCEQKRADEQLPLLMMQNGERNEAGWKEMADRLVAYLQDDLGVEVEIKGQIGETEHIFTHRVWTMPIVECQLVQECEPGELSQAWVMFEQFKEYPIPTVYQKVIREVWGK